MSNKCTWCMPVHRANELIRSVIRPTRPGPSTLEGDPNLPPFLWRRTSLPKRINREWNQSYLLTVSLESHFNPRRKTELMGLLPPPPITLELRGKSDSHHQEKNRAKRHLTFPPSHWGFIIITNHHVNYHHLSYHHLCILPKNSNALEDTSESILGIPESTHGSHFNSFSKAESFGYVRIDSLQPFQTISIFVNN
ncbi:hypothetical protein PIB30_041013 [Stylosanthes scabra]|uniref:Uncharacterized protein n=1 Tax=Stylosanthes scabra TaxID=79078 RepID=A0ABU6YDL6_9FABA|nr:hypothetical protein [Stylosanthes scabra]